MSPFLFLAAFAAAVAPAPAAPAQPDGAAIAEAGKGGPYEPLDFDLSTIVLHDPKPAPLIAPDPFLQRRYGPRETRPLNAITIRF
jgi:hypothetical protein